jgi:hypothetical protein
VEQLFCGLPVFPREKLAVSHTVGVLVSCHCYQIR